MIRACAWGALIAIFVNIVIIVAMVGGPQEMKEILEPMVQPALRLPLIPEAALLNASHPVGMISRFDGIHVLITGANRGLGFGLAQQFLVHGAHVIMAVRSGIPHAGHAVADSVGMPRERVRMVQVDLSDIESVVRMVSTLQREDVPVHVVVLNAALVDVSAEPSGCGTVNRQWMVNYLANVVLTKEIVARNILRTPPASNGFLNKPRIVYISSGTYAVAGTIDFFGAGMDNQWNALNAIQMYGQSKFLTQAWMQKLHVVLDGYVDVVSHNPGPVYTALGKEHVPWVLMPTYTMMKDLLFPSAYVAAHPVICLTDRAFSSGTYMHIREVMAVTALAQSTETHEWLVRHTAAALEECGYALTMDNWQSKPTAPGI